MAVKSVDVLKTYFETGDKPTQQQFWDWLDSFVHKGDGIAIGDVDGLTEILQGKADASAINGRIYSEVPEGVVDGTNTDFVVEHAPIAGKHSLYINGVKQRPDSYTITGVNLSTNTAPQVDEEGVPDELLFDYDYNI